MNGSGGNVAGCATCKGRCCREYRVEVTATDVRAIATGTGLDPADFAVLRETAPQRAGFRMAPGGPAMQIDLVRNSVTGACVFLMEIAPDLARCGIYAHRPLVCRNFPTYLKRGVVAVREDVKCGPGAWNLATMDMPTYRRDLVRGGEAYQEHHRAIVAWNAQVDAAGRERTPAELFEFLRTPVAADA